MAKDDTPTLVLAPSPREIMAKELKELLTFLSTPQVKNKLYGFTLKGKGLNHYRQQLKHRIIKLEAPRGPAKQPQTLSTQKDSENNG